MENGHNSLNKQLTYSCLVVICFRNIYEIIEETIVTHSPACKIIDDTEMSDIISSLINNIINDILSLSFKNTSLLQYDIDGGDVYQQNIDYLIYIGISQQNAFLIVHNSELLILKILLDVIPDIDDKNKYKIKEMKLSNKELTITVEVMNNVFSGYFDSINISKV